MTYDYHPALRRPAVSQCSATSPDLLRWFKAWNLGKTYAEGVKPFGFLYALHARSPGMGGRPNLHLWWLAARWLSLAISPLNLKKNILRTRNKDGTHVHRRAVGAWRGVAPGNREIEGVGTWRRH